MWDILCWMCSLLSSWAPLSSVKSNEQMLLSCWSQHDGLSCWQAYPSAVKKWERSSGQWTACQGVLTLLCISSFFPLIPALVSNIQELSMPMSQLQHSTTYCPVHLSPCQPFCSADHLPVMCPCPQLGKSACEKVKLLIIRSTRPLTAKKGKKERKTGKTDVIELWLH